MFDSLYNKDILSLAASLKHQRLDDYHGQAHKVSRLCGSEVEIDIQVKDEKITAYALRVKACALGQASAAILQEDIIGCRLEELKSARNGLTIMFKTGHLPDLKRFRKLILLADAKEYPARHTSIGLAFDAAIEAFSHV